MKITVQTVVMALLLCAAAWFIAAARTDYEHKRTQCVATGGQWHFVGRYPTCSHS